MDFLLNTDFHQTEFECPCCGEMRVQHPVIIAIQCMRNFLGFPLHVTSGYRCLKYNAKIKGAKNSRHPVGMALDIQFRSDLQLYLILRHAQSFGFMGIGVYYDRNFIHLDFRQDTAFWYE